MHDDKYVIMEQCAKDARQLYHSFVFLHHNSQAINSYQDLASWMGPVAAALFLERCRDPITPEKMQAVLLGHQLADDRLAELKNMQKDINEALVQLEALRAKINQHQIELRNLEKEKAVANAERFLESTIGSAQLAAMKANGEIAFRGSNGATYLLSNNGTIHRKGLSGWNFIGRLQNSEQNIPLPDAIATVYAHLMADADFVEKNKACGNIFISRSR